MSFQIPLLDVTEDSLNQEWGTFKDSLRAPIHNWFTYPAGFSYKAVQASFKKFGVQKGSIVYDPFMGSGTTNIVAKKHSIDSYGVEAHPFVFRIARTKLNWEIDNKIIKEINSEIKSEVIKTERVKESEINALLSNEFPELLLRCYEDRTLYDLMLIKNYILSRHFSSGIEDFLFVGLTSILRQVSMAATGWPYIAPKKQKTSSVNKNAVIEFYNQILRMSDDLIITRNEADKDYLKSRHEVYCADSRNVHDLIETDFIDHVFTSPPYLNNFDYADRTRLELYFWGEAKTWGDISRDIRTKLITSATTQISRDDKRYILSEEIKSSCPKEYDFLIESSNKLSAIRLTKGGKKSYDHLVSGYFNDIFKIISEVYRVMKRKSTAVFVLGDSAPYGIHIPTDELIGKIGVGIGFSDYSIQELRKRGDKWKNNPQRHGIKLRESIVSLHKG